MLNEANTDMVEMSVENRRQQNHKFAARNAIRRLDQLLGELEKLHLQERAHVPGELRRKIVELCGDDGRPQPRSVSKTLDLVFNLQEYYMRQIRDELNTQEESAA